MRSSVIMLVAVVALSLPARAQQRWRLVDVWRSAGDTRLALSFDEVIDLQLATDGQLLLLTGGQNPQLVTVDNTGRPVGSTRGFDDVHPFRSPNGIVQLRDGRIVVNDPVPGRLVIFDEAGRPLRQVPYEPWGWTARWIRVVDTEGALLEPVARDRRLVWRRWRPDFSTFDFVAPDGCDAGLVEAPMSASFHLRGPDNEAVEPVPFLQPPVAIVRGPDGGSWRGVGPTYRTIVHSGWRSCDDDATITLSGDPVPVSDEALDTARADIARLAAELGAPRPDLGRVPTTRPMFHALHLDRQRRVWVERYAAGDTRTLSIFGADGQHLADIDVLDRPIDTQRPVTFSDNHVFYFTTDESGWTWLVAARIERMS